MCVIYAVVVLNNKDILSSVALTVAGFFRFGFDRFPWRRQQPRRNTSESHWILFSFFSQLEHDLGLRVLLVCFVSKAKWIILKIEEMEKDQCALPLKKIHFILFRLVFLCAVGFSTRSPSICVCTAIFQPASEWVGTGVKGGGGGLSRYGARTDWAQRQH